MPRWARWPLDAVDPSWMSEHRRGTAAPVVRARGVTKRYRSTLAVDGLDVDIGHGITGLLGPNGAGKTTFISLVLGLRTRDAGELTVLGHDPATAGIDVRARIGFAPEHHNLPPDVHAADLVRHLGELHGLPRRAAIQRANDALWQVGLGEERFRPIGTMSTGQRQRVKLAGAIVHDPDLVLLDEPTDGLDPLQREDMLALIRRVGTEFGMDIVISSHHLEEAEQICDAVVILGDGAVVRAGILSELSRSDTERLVVVVDDRTPELAALLRAAGFEVDEEGEALSILVGDGLHDAVRDAVADLGDRDPPDRCRAPDARGRLHGGERVSDQGARIYDVGYRAYDGPRSAPIWALVTIWLHTLQRVLGLHRSFRHKVLPGIALVIAYVPALIFVGIAAFVPIDPATRRFFRHTASTRTSSGWRSLSSLRSSPRRPCVPTGVRGCSISIWRARSTSRATSPPSGQRWQR